MRGGCSFGRQSIRLGALTWAKFQPDLSFSFHRRAPTVRSLPPGSPRDHTSVRNDNDDDRTESLTPAGDAAFFFLRSGGKGGGTPNGPPNGCHQVVVDEVSIVYSQKTAVEGIGWVYSVGSSLLGVDAGWIHRISCQMRALACDRWSGADSGRWVCCCSGPWSITEMSIGKQDK